MNCGIRDTFLTDGVVHFSSALTRHTLDEALLCWQWTMDHPGPLAARMLPNGRVKMANGLDAARSLETDTGGFFFQDGHNPSAKKIYRSLVCNPDIQRVVETVFGSGRKAWFLGEQALLKDPGTPATDWHQDIPDFRLAAHPDDMVCLWIPFDPVEAGTSLKVAKRSHRGPVYSSIYGQYRAEEIPKVDENPEDFDVISFACEPGDLVAFHLAALHGGAPTPAEQRRRSLSLRFFGEDAVYQSRLNPGDPLNGQPFRMKTATQVLPIN